MQSIVTECSMVCLSVCHDREPYKDGWTDWDTVWTVDSGWPTNHALDGIQIPCDWAVLRGEGARPVVKYWDCQSWTVQKYGWSDQDTVWDEDSAGLKIGWLEFNVPFQHKYDYIRESETRLGPRKHALDGGCILELPVPGK